MRFDLTRKFVVAFAALCALVILSVPAEAQRRRRPAARGYTRDEVNRLIKRVEERSDAFIKLFDKSLDNSRLDDSRREDELNRMAKNLESTLDDLRSEFDRMQNYIETRPEVRRCLDIASDINVAVRNRKLGGETERQWALLRAELNTLADVYNLAFVGSPEYL